MCGFVDGLSLFARYSTEPVKRNATSSTSKQTKKKSNLTFKSWCIAKAKLISITSLFRFFTRMDCY